VRAEFVNPFLRAALEVLEAELGATPTRHPIGLDTGPYTGAEVVALVALTGRVAGIALYGMSEATARAIVSRMLGQEFLAFDELAQSGIGELGNVITGRAAVLLAEAGYSSELAPPLVLSGASTRLSSLGVPRLRIPLGTPTGPVEVQIALKEQARAAAVLGHAA
jgi:chemotaxis protein CheX